MKVELFGVRGSMPASGAAFAGVGGHTSCVAITPAGHDCPTLLLDTGTGVAGVTAALRGEPFRGSVVWSHLHWDHVQGLPFFAAGDRPDASVTAYLPAQDDTRPGAPESAIALLARAMSPPHFPIDPTGLQGRWRFEAVDAGRIEAGGCLVRLIDVPHKGGRTFGIRVEADGTAIAYLPDHDPSIDAGPALELARGCDLLLHDAQFVAGERTLARAYGHAVIDDALALAIGADVGRLVLIHHAPTRTDADVAAIGVAAATAVSTGPDVVVGREGDVFHVGHADRWIRPVPVDNAPSG